MIDELGQFVAFDVENNVTLNLPASGEFRCLVTNLPSDFHYIGDTKVIGRFRIESGQPIDNITDWALKQFRAHYKGSVTPANAGVPRPSDSEQEESPDPGVRRDDERGKSARGKGKAPPITKEDIFHYVYAVLHDPVYREKYAQNLKREFPRIPFYADFWRWSQWGRELMDLHIGYERVEPWPLARTEVADEKARKNGALPKTLLKADKDGGRIVIDSETTLAGVPAEAWDYRLGNRCALEWILDQYKEKTPKDPTIRAKFNTYRFADYKDKVIDLLARVTRVSVETQRIVAAMRQAER
jgi:predicted helicase